MYVSAAAWMLSGGNVVDDDDDDDDDCNNDDVVALPDNVSKKSLSIKHQQKHLDSLPG